MSKLIVDILIGLPGSGKTTWLQTKNTPGNVFDNIGDNDPDLQRFKSVVSDLKVDRISISEIQFADIHVLFKTLTLLHETIESFGREDEYNFILFPQSESYCLRNVENQPNAIHKNEFIKNFSPTITQTFMFLKSKFPKFIQEVRISPTIQKNSPEIIDSSQFQVYNDSLGIEPTLETNLENLTENIQNNDKNKVKGFSIANIFRKTPHAY